MLSVMAFRYPRENLRHGAAQGKPVEHLDGSCQCSPPSGLTEGLSMQADPGSPQSQKYTWETFKDKMSPKVPFPRLWGERPQRQSSGPEPGNVPWLPLMAPKELLLSLVPLRLCMEDFSGAEGSQEESPLGLSLARLRHSGSSYKPAVC